MRMVYSIGLTASSIGRSNCCVSIMALWKARDGKVHKIQILDQSLIKSWILHHGIVEGKGPLKIPKGSFEGFGATLKRDPQRTFKFNFSSP